MKIEVSLQTPTAKSMAMQEPRRIKLNGNEVTYTLVRGRRKTVGVKIDREGLTVRIPSKESLGRVEMALQKRAGWIIQKLAEWKNKKPVKPGWREGDVLPLLGEPWLVRVAPTGHVSMVRENAAVQTERSHLSLPLPPVTSTDQLEKAVMAWYRLAAMACFKERVAFYADRLGVEVPQLRLSNARTLWGSCTARGVIRLNWRLIQKPVQLVDYVIAHELSHLIEMNHSKAFWRTVESIYPDYAIARKQLRSDG